VPVNDLIHNEGVTECVVHQLNMRVDEPLPLVEPKFTETPAILLFPPKRFWYKPKLNKWLPGIIL
jgi:hypothetical protein